MIANASHLVRTLFPLACQSGRCRANELFLMRKGGLVGIRVARAERIELALNLSAQTVFAGRASGVSRLVERALDSVGASLSPVLWISC